MHWTFSKFSNKHDRHDVKEAIEHSFQAELTMTELSWLMLYYFFADASETRPFCDHWYIAMHFTIHLDVFDNIMVYQNYTPKEALKSILIEKMGALALPTMQGLQNSLKKRGII